ncbi:hypothetical protein HanIR_Chr10g0496701 [Helianthus annuus]|nr:hypothetical protein HanIR_Chr10g0496701 [Helianthus annuus]
MIMVYKNGRGVRIEARLEPERRKNVYEAAPQGQILYVRLSEVRRTIRVEAELLCRGVRLCFRQDR